MFRLVNPERTLLSDVFGPERRRCARAVELGAAVPARAGQLTLHAGAEHADAAAEAAHRAGAVQRGGGAVAAVVAPIDGRRAGCGTRRQRGASGGAAAAVAGEVRDAGGALRELTTRQRRLQQRVDGGVTQQARRVMLQGGG